MSSAALAAPLKSPDAFRTISEVALELDVPQHVLRFWESRFVQIKPVKRAGGRRFYRPEDVDLLRGGLTATADIITGKRENVLQAPNRAIKGLAGDFWVDVVTNASTAATEKRPVKTGLQNKKSTEIISGLKEGEQVLIEAIK